MECPGVRYLAKVVTALLLSLTGSKAFPMPTGKLAVPVSWQLTRTELGSGVGRNITESYRETWYLTLNPSGLMTLTSQHATVPVNTSQVDLGSSMPPELLFLSEYDLAKLAGVHAHLEATRGSQDKVDRARSNVVALTVSTLPGKRLTTTTLQWSDETHVSITVEMGSVRSI